MKKRLFQLLLFVSLFAALLSANAAAEELVPDGDCGPGIYWKLDSRGSLFIWGNNAMYYYLPDKNVHESPWSGNKSIKSVRIDKGVTSIVDNAFYNCTGLTSIEIPDSVTSIGDDAFYGCTALKSVTIPDTVTFIGEAAFQQSGLTSITIPHKVVFIADKTFKECKSLSSAVIQNGDNSQGPISIGAEAFYGCLRLNSIAIPDSVTSIGNRAFQECSFLFSADVGNNVETIGESAFLKCTILESVKLGDKLKTIGKEAFKNCSALFSVSLPESLTFIDVGAFQASGLTSIVIPNQIGVISESTFSDCGSLASVTLSPVLASIDKAAFKNCSSLLTIDIPEPTRSIGKEAFRASGLTSIVLPQRIKTVEESVFHSCVDLASVTIQGNITSIGASAFHSCSSLTDLALPNSLISIGKEAFRQSGLLFMSVPSSVTSIGSAAFRQSALHSVVIPNSVKILETNLFYGCNHLTYATLLEDSTSSENITTIKEGVFQECRYLESISVPRSVTSIGKSAFEWCERMKVAFLPCDKVETIAERTFFGCSSLTYMLLPKNLTTIKKEAFRGCTNLATLVMPASVTKIEDSAFYSCGSLADIYYGGSAANWDVVPLSASNYPLISATNLHHVYFNTPAALSAGVNARFSTSIPAGSGLYVALLDFNRCELNPELTYNLYCAFYDSAGKMLFVKNKEVRFASDFHEHVLVAQDPPTQSEKVATSWPIEAGMTCRIFLLDARSAPLAMTQVYFTGA